MTEEAPKTATPEQEAFAALQGHLDSIKALIRTLKTIRGEPVDRPCQRCAGDEDAKVICKRCEGTGVEKDPFPTVITGITGTGVPFHPTRGGSLVQVKPCGSEFGDKTYIGWHVGDLAQAYPSFIDENGVLVNRFIFHNPMIFIPEINKTVLGMECWWSRINDISELKSITDADISSAIYAMMEKSLAAARATEAQPSAPDAETAES